LSNPTPLITHVGPTIFCNGDSVLLSTSLYVNYSWGSKDLIVKTSGSYSVTVTDAFGCVGTSIPTVVVVNSNPNPTITGSFSYCPNDSTQLSTGSYSNYLWITGDTVQSPYVDSGSYTVSVTDSNGCVGASLPQIVKVNTNPTPSITGTLSYCKNDSTQLNTGSYFTYLWSNGDTIQNPFVDSGSYFVTVTDTNGCSGISSSVTVVEYALPMTPTITFNSMDSSITSSSLNGNQWFLNSIIIPSAINQTYKPLSKGSYTVVVTNTNGCSSDTSLIHNIYHISSLDENNLSHYITINGRTFTAITDWYVYDMSGKLLSNGGSGTFSIPSGVSILQTQYGTTRITNFNR
jgi:hypothetical protein